MVVYVDVVAYDEAIQMTTQKGGCGWLYTHTKFPWDIWACTQTLSVTKIKILFINLQPSSPTRLHRFIHSSYYHL